MNAARRRSGARTKANTILRDDFCLPSGEHLVNVYRGANIPGTFWLIDLRAPKHVLFNVRLTRETLPARHPWRERVGEYAR
jgi:hypothetical protein